METIEKKSHKEIGHFVAEDYRTAAVFSKYNIDFCCNGNRTVEEACDKKGIDSSMIMDEINRVLNQEQDETINYKSWPLDLLSLIHI